jgi:hypothetical protein
MVSVERSVIWGTWCLVDWLEWRWAAAAVKVRNPGPSGSVLLSMAGWLWTVTSHSHRTHCLSLFGDTISSIIKIGGWQRPHRLLHSLPRCIPWHGTSYRFSKPNKNQHNAPLPIINQVLDFSFSCLYQSYGFCECQYVHKKFKRCEHLNINFKRIHDIFLNSLFVTIFWKFFISN